METRQTAALSGAFGLGTGLLLDSEASRACTTSRMKTITFGLAAVVALVGRSAGAQTAPLVCYGTEPAWTLDLGEGAARLSVRGEEDVEYRGRATAVEVMEDLSGNPSYSTVRTQLRVLESKGHVRHEDDGVRYVYIPEVPRHAARRSALRHLVDTFFDGSAEKVVGALLGGEGARVSDEELDRIASLVAKAKKEGSR